MRFKTGFLILLLGLLVSFSAIAAEYNDGAIRLVLDEGTGRFSIYSLRHEGSRRRPLALFVDQDPRTSFLSVMINDRSYKMGDSSAFRVRLGGSERNPSLIFESSFMLVIQEFSFVRSPDSTETNGVSVKLTLENRGDRQVSAGARFLLDTNLGEGSFPFATNLRTISGEAVLTAAEGDNWWIDRNDKVSLTGSLFTGSPEDPDNVHFANWKKLSEVSWKAPYQPGRNFNFPPFSVGDAAVCYYYEPRPLSRGEKRSLGFTLLLNSEKGFGSAQVFSAGEVIRNLTATDVDRLGTREQDLAAIRELMMRIDSLIASGTATAEELAAIELALNSLRAKYPGVNLR